MTKLSPGKLPGLFAAITIEMLGGFSTAADAPFEEYELPIRRKWEKLRQLFIKYGLSLASEADLTKVGLSADFMMRNNMPQGFRHEYSTADILQYTPQIFVDPPEPGHPAGTITRIKRAFDGGGWVVTVGFWSLSFNIPDQFVDYGDDADVLVKTNQGIEYRLRLCNHVGGMLSRDRLQDRIAKRQMTMRIEGSTD